MCSKMCALLIKNFCSMKRNYLSWLRNLSEYLFGLMLDAKPNE